MSPNTPDLDALLAHSGWVRALAQNLVSDPATADDVAQQAWQTALERAPRHGSNLRSWWSSVVWSSAGKRWREQAARQRLEQKLAARETSRASPPPDELAERLDTFQRLASAVAQLPEPYGSAIYLRFFEELSVKEVAKRQGLPLATAQSHITRGLERLRRALQKDLGEDWRHRCLLFAVPMQAAPWLSLGPLTILAMNTKTTLSLAVGLLTLLTLFLWNPWAAEDLSQHQDSLVAGTYEGGGDSSLSASPSAAVMGAAEMLREDMPVIPAAGVEGKVAVRIRDAVTLEAVPNAVVHYLPYSTWKEPEVERIIREEKPGPYERITRFGQRFQADATGVLHLPAPNQRFGIVAEEGKTFGYRWFFDPAEVRQGFEILLYPEIQVTVEVRDEQGKPVAGAQVGFNHAPFAYTNSPSLQVATDADGKATFAHLELETSDFPERPGSFALLVPSTPAQRFEVAAADLPNAHLEFVMPQTGTVNIEAVDGSGFPLDNGTPVVLQLANDVARAVANGGNPELRNRFSMQLSESMQIAYVREGVASFSQVGIGTELAAASYDDEANGYAVAIVNGPGHAGDVVQASLALSKAPGELRFRLINADGEQIALPDGHSMFLSGVDEVGSRFGHGDSPLRERDGSYRLPLTHQELNAKELWLATSPPWQASGATLRFGMLRLDVTLIKQAGQVYEVPFATDHLLNAKMVNADGVTQKNALINWEVIPLEQGQKDGAPGLGSTQLSERWKNIRSDEQGKVDVWGPTVPEGCQYRIQQGGEGLLYHIIQSEIPFELGPDPQYLVLAATQSIDGFVVVDQPSMLNHLQTYYGIGVPGQPGFALVPLKLELPNGRFSVLPGALGAGPVAVVVRSRYTEEVLYQLPDVASVAHEVDGKQQLPDIDLRGNLFAHQVKATSAQGEELGNLCIQPLNSWMMNDFPQNGMILSKEPVVQVELRAQGYLAKEVFLQGETTVVLEEAPQMTIRSSVDLPQHPQVKWTLHILPTANETSILMGEDGQALDFQSGSASFDLAKEGNWAIVLQATVPGLQEVSTLSGAYIFPSGSPFKILELGNHPDYVQVLNLQLDALQAALDEALVEAGLSED